MTYAPLAPKWTRPSDPQTPKPNRPINAPTHNDRHDYHYSSSTSSKPSSNPMGGGGSKAAAPAAPAAGEGPQLGKSGKKICCSCPETKKVGM